jgi:hypothetical protein
MPSRLFFPQPEVDQWAVDGTIDLTASELVLLEEGRAYKVQEAVRVLAEVTGANDPHELVGKVKPRVELEGKGAEILENSMILGDFAYDVVPGWVAEPSTSFAEHMKSPERKAARNAKPAKGAPPASEIDLVRRFAQGEL